MNQVPHTGPTNVRRHRAEFSRPGHVAGCIRAPLVSALRVVQVRDVIFLAPHCSLLDINRYVVTLLLFSESHPRKNAGPSEPYVPGCFLPAIRNYVTAVGCSPAPNIPARTTAVIKCPVISTNVISTDCAWPAICADVMCSVRRCGTDGRDVLLLRFKRGRARLKAIIGLR